MTNVFNNRLRVGLRLQQPTGLWTNAFGYDAAKRLTSVTSPAGAFSYTLGATAPGSAQIKKLLLPNTSYITNTYDGNARLLSTTLKNSSHTTLNAHEYGYNAGNQRTQQVFSVGSTYNYTYDAIGQLKVADSATASEDRGYLYDAAWNLNRRTNNAYVEQFDVDSKNQLDFPGYYTYDGNGNLTWFDVFEYTYDDENRLIKAASPGGDWWTDYVYDGLGRLRQRVVWTYEYVDDDFYWVPVETRYVYDGFRVIQDRNAQGNPTISYTRGTDLSGSLEPVLNFCRTERQA